MNTRLPLVLVTLSAMWKQFGPRLSTGMSKAVLHHQFRDRSNNTALSACSLLPSLLQEHTVQLNLSETVHADPIKFDAYRTSGDIIAHRDSEPNPDGDVLRWNSNRKCSAVGRKRKPRPARDPRQVAADEPVNRNQKDIAAQLMRKVHGKKNRMLEVLLDNDQRGDGSVTHEQLRDGVKNLGLQDNQCDVLLQE